MRKLFTSMYNENEAAKLCQSMLESSIGDVVSAFQKFSSSLYNELTGKEIRVNKFQSIDSGCKLFKEELGKAYTDFLTDNEMKIIKMYFQRRHIIEHNNAFVDKNYLDKSGDASYTLEQRLVVKERDAFLFLNIVRKLGSGLLTLRKEVHE